MRHGRLCDPSSNARRPPGADRHLQSLHRQYGDHVRPSDAHASGASAVVGRSRRLRAASAARGHGRPRPVPWVCEQQPVAPEAGVQHNGGDQRVLSSGCAGTWMRNGALHGVVRRARARRRHTIVAGVSLPNPASLSLHERFGFRPVGVFHAVGRKFDTFWDVAWFERSLR